MSQTKQPWNHTQMCPSCQTNSASPDFVYKNGSSGCRHYRGGKSLKDSGRLWPKLERASHAVL
jgi:hypothetical protein